MIECLFNTQEVLVLASESHKLSTVMHICNLGSMGIISEGTGQSEVQRHPQLYSEFKPA